MFPIVEAAAIDLDVSYAFLFPPTFSARRKRITSILIDNVRIEVSETRDPQADFSD